MKSKSIYWGFSFTLLAAFLLSACQPGAGGSSTSLQETVWLLQSYLDNQENTVQALSGSNVFIVFSNDGKVAGNATCNRFSGSYTINGDKISINPGAMTLMMCPGEDLMDQERDFIAALSGAASYKIEGDLLNLLAEDGSTLITLKAQSASVLSDSNWQAVAYYDGQGFTSLLAGTEITAMFSADGKLSGSAGCNNYNASFKVDGGKITISAPASTRKMCSSPQGIMEQESAYLAALEKAITYQVTGNTLLIQGVDGLNLVQFVAK